MSLINPLILYGLALGTIPVILHLLLRTKPKKLLFPALRLIQMCRQSNTRRMRLRHIWLLLLRIAVIALLVFALSRPSLPAANYSPSFGESLTAILLTVTVLGVYWGVLHFWRRRRVSHQVLAYRRSILRGGTGIAFLLLFLLSVAWPYQKRIAAEITAPLPQIAENLPVSAVFLFDTSQSMEYRLENKSRLEVARKFASQHLSTLPPASRVAVADTSADSQIVFQADLVGAQSRIEALETNPILIPINDRLRSAIETQEQDRNRKLGEQSSVPTELRTDRFLREIYLFTDLAQSSWKMAAARSLREKLVQAPWIHVYIIDVGVEKPTNVAITSLRLSKQTIPKGNDLIVQAIIQATGLDGKERSVELYVRNDVGKLVKHGQSMVKFDSESAVNVTFSVRGLSAKISQGEVRLVSSDPLPIDDVQYFSVAVLPPPEILVVGESKSEAEFWLQALSPTELERLGKFRYRVTFLRASNLAEANLGPFETICLVNVVSPNRKTWQKLADFVEAGGGLAVFLGTRKISPVSYNSQAAQSFLPGELFGHIKFTPPETLDLQNLEHPLLKKFDNSGYGVGELASREVRRCWRVTPNENAAVIASFTDPRHSPALLDRIFGKGRTVMLTTAVDLEGWSDLPLAGWSFLALADQMMQYLAQRADAVYNYTAGSTVLLPLDRETPLEHYLLRKPGFQQLPGEIPPRSETLRIDDADQIGHYEVVSAEKQSPFAAGFSVNPLPGESNFRRLQEADFDQLLGEKRYSIARTMDDLVRGIGAVRIGQEMYSFVLMFAVLIFAAEHLVANRFYENQQTSDAE